MLNQDLDELTSLLYQRERNIRQVFIIEFKSITKREDIELAARDAIRQIHDKGYDTPFVSNEITSKKVRYIAVILQGKRVIVREDLITG